MAAFFGFKMMHAGLRQIEELVKMLEMNIPRIQSVKNRRHVVTPGKRFNFRPQLVENPAVGEMSFLQQFQKFSRRKSVKYGAPFLIMMVGGSFALKEFTQLRYQFSKKATFNNDIMDKLGVKMKKPEEVTLETEYEKIKEIDIDNWENVRGPRPWEDTEKK